MWVKRGPCPACSVQSWEMEYRGRGRPPLNFHLCPACVAEAQARAIPRSLALSEILARLNAPPKKVERPGLTDEQREKAAAYRRAWYQRTKADPERLARHRAICREKTRRYRERQGEAVNQRRKVARARRREALCG